MRKGQSILEYSVLMAVVAAAFMSMQYYMKHGFEGRWKDAADQLGDQYDTNAFNGNMRTTINNITESRVWVQTLPTGKITYREDTSTATEIKNGMSHIDRSPL